MNTRHTASVLGTTLAATGLAAAALLGAISPAHATPTPAAPSVTKAAAAAPTDGWSAVVIAKPGATGTLTLVSPTGAQYPVTALGSAWSVSDVSNDGRRVLVVNPAGEFNAYRVIDTRTARSTAVNGNFFELRFTNPSGAALIGRTVANGSLVRTSLTGAVQARFAATSGGDGILPSMDGTLVVSRNARRQLQVNANAGRVVRTLANPRGMSWCNVQHWSDATHFTAYCLPTGSRSDVQVYRWSTAGGAPVAVTGALPRSGSLQFGYIDSWATPKGQMVVAASSCGPNRIAIVQGRRVNLLAAGQGADPLGVKGTSVWLLNGAQCDTGTTWLTRHDVATGRTVVLAGGTRNKGLSVTSVALVERHQ